MLLITILIQPAATLLAQSTVGPLPACIAAKKAHPGKRIAQGAVDKQFKFRFAFPGNFLQFGHGQFTGQNSTNNSFGGSKIYPHRIVVTHLGAGVKSSFGKNCLAIR